MVIVFKVLQRQCHYFVWSLLVGHAEQLQPRCWRPRRSGQGKTLSRLLKFLELSERNRQKRSATDNLTAVPAEQICTLEPFIQHPQGQLFWNGENSSRRTIFVSYACSVYNFCNINLCEEPLLLVNGYRIQSSKKIMEAYWLVMRGNRSLVSVLVVLAKGRFFLGS